MPAQLKVAREDLLQAFKTLRAVLRPSHKTMVNISFEDQMLVFDTGAASMKVPAGGEWDGCARLTSRGVLTLARAVPTDDVLLLRVEDQKLCLGNYAVSCEWVEDKGGAITLPLGARLPEILALRMKYSDEQIENAGLVEVVRQAEARRDTIILRAADQLQPLGVSANDLHELVRNRVRRIEGQ